MTDAVEHAPNNRLLVLAPTARDAATTRSLLAEAGIQSLACSSLPELCREAEEGAAALMLTEEALGSNGAASFFSLLDRQPPWSDLPVLLLVGGAAESRQARSGLEKLGNVTLLDRPIRVAVLVSAVKTALRSRQRQYELRE